MATDPYEPGLFDYRVLEAVKACFPRRCLFRFHPNGSLYRVLEWYEDGYALVAPRSHPADAHHISGLKLATCYFVCEGNNLYP